MSTSTGNDSSTISPHKECDICIIIIINYCICNLILSLSEWKQKEMSGTDDLESESSILVREKKLVDKFLIKSGMLRFSFLLECCHPGSIPDPQLVAAMLELVCSVLIFPGVSYFPILYRYGYQCAEVNFCRFFAVVEQKSTLISKGKVFYFLKT